jgi:hypothetical protein
LLVVAKFFNKSRGALVFSINSKKTFCFQEVFYFDY